MKHVKLANNHASAYALIGSIGSARTFLGHCTRSKLSVHSKKAIEFCIGSTCAWYGETCWAKLDLLPFIKNQNKHKLSFKKSKYFDFSQRPGPVRLTYFFFQPWAPHFFYGVLVLWVNLGCLLKCLPGSSLNTWIYRSSCI